MLPKAEEAALAHDDVVGKGDAKEFACTLQTSCRLTILPESATDHPRGDYGPPPLRRRMNDRRRIDFSRVN